MDLSRKHKYEQFATIKLTDFYKSVSEIMSDFGGTMYQTIKEVENRRRIEIWAQNSNEEDKSIVWLELIKPEEVMDPYLTTDVLRALNDENVERLFFFTNSTLEDDDREVLEGPNHFIFTTDEIVETLMSLEEKRTIVTVRKRKVVRTASGLVLIKNFFKRNQPHRMKVRLRMSATPDIVRQYTNLVRKILHDIDAVHDISEIPYNTRETLKKIQFDLLPELAKTPNFIFPRQFAEVQNLLFNLVEISIIYIGNFIEYEAEDDLKNNREIIEELLINLENIDDQVLSFKADLLYHSEKSAVRVIVTSAVITFIAMMLLIVVRFGHD